MSAEQRRKSRRKQNPVMIPVHGRLLSSSRGPLQKSRRARWQYINTVIQKDFGDNNTRPFWKFVKAQRQDNFGIPPLKHHGVLHNDSKTKAQIMLDEFTSVFAREDTFSIPRVDPVCQHVITYWPIAGCPHWASKKVQTVPTMAQHHGPALVPMAVRGHCRIVWNACIGPSFFRRVDLSFPVCVWIPKA